MNNEQSGVAPCPFCGAGPDDIDPTGWLDGAGNRGPECLSCGATARSLQAWNRREHRQCHRPPAGWTCTRVAEHDGPCAAFMIGVPTPFPGYPPVAEDRKLTATELEPPCPECGQRGCNGECMENL